MFEIPSLIYFYICLVLLTIVAHLNKVLILIIIHSYSQL